MFQYNPTVNDVSGEISARNQMLAAQAMAGATVESARINAEARARRQAALDGLIGTGIDVAKTAAGFAIGGPTGAMIASKIPIGSNAGEGIGGMLEMITQQFGQKESAGTLDKMMGMAKDEGLMTQDTLEKFVNLPWKQKAPVFDLWRQTMMPIQANRMKVQDQAQIWGDYRGRDGSAGPQPFTY